MPLELLAFLVLVLVLAVWLVIRQQNRRLREILPVLPVKLRRGHLAPR